MDGRLVLRCKVSLTEFFKFYSEVTPMTAMLLISAHIPDPFRMLRSLRTWDKGIDINPEDETFYTPKYQEAFLKYVQNEYCAKHQCVLVV